MTSQTTEECRHCKVAEAQGVTHIHPEETEIEEVSDCELYDHIPVPYDVAFWHCSVCGKELYFNTIEALLSQQQKYREAWLREEIVKLEVMQSKQKVDNGHECYDPFCTYCENRIKDEAIQTIIDRYQAELNQDNK